MAVLRAGDVEKSGQLMHGSVPVTALNLPAAHASHPVNPPWVVWVYPTGQVELTRPKCWSRINKNINQRVLRALRTSLFMGHERGKYCFQNT